MGFDEDHELRKEKAGLERARHRDAIECERGERERETEGKMEGFLLSRVLIRNNSHWIAPFLSSTKLR